MQFTVCINAGHCCEDGAEHGCCYYGCRECDITYKVGRAVVEELLTRGYNAQFVQNDSLDYIVDFANGVQANLFVSLHCDAVADPSACGTTAYWYRDSEACKAGNAIRDNICKALGTYNRYYLHDCNYWVCIHTAMPATLIEMFYLSNEEDLKKYNDNFDKLVIAICDGIDTYFK